MDARRAKCHDGSERHSNSNLQLRTRVPTRPPALTTCTSPAPVPAPVPAPEPVPDSCFKSAQAQFFGQRKEKGLILLPRRAAPRIGFAKPPSQAKSPYALNETAQAAQFSAAFPWGVWFGGVVKLWNSNRNGYRNRNRKRVWSVCCCLVGESGFNGGR
jgi:hypothetical protein